MVAIEKRQRTLADGTKGPVHWRVHYRDTKNDLRSKSFAKRAEAEKWQATNAADKVRGN
jgi:hypothetical protein